MKGGVCSGAEEATPLSSSCLGEGKVLEGETVQRSQGISENSLALPKSSYLSVTGFGQQEGQIQEPRKEMARYRNRDISQRQSLVLRTDNPKRDWKNHKSTHLKALI